MPSYLAQWCKYGARSSMLITDTMAYTKLVLVKGQCDTVAEEDLV